MKIQILCDNPNSWIMPHASELVEKIKILGHEAVLIDDGDNVLEGDILIMLSCEKIFKKLHLNKHNLVVHESALPLGKGWSPLTWQVLEGKTRIPITLFEAVEKVDAGDIYGQEIIEFDGTELVDELRVKQATTTQNLVLNFIKNFPNVRGIPQQGQESFYPRRRPEDSKLDPNQSIINQFNLLRVCDNERYPAWFEINGVKYIVKIFKAE